MMTNSTFQLQNDFLSQFEYLHNFIAYKALELEPIDIQEDYDKSICEIKLFYWAYGSTFFKKKMSRKMYKLTSEFFKSQVAFSSLKDYSYSSGHLDLFFNVRLDFYSLGQKVKDEDTLNEFFSLVYLLWFDEPLNIYTDHIPASSNFFENIERIMKIKIIYKNVMPAYMESLEELFEILNHRKFRRWSLLNYIK